MTARILTCCTPPVAALADKLLEALLPISVTLGMVTSGIVTDVEAIVTSRIMVSYSSTTGFGQMHCGSNLQSQHYLSFWCDWSSGDGAVMMIGGGGDSCSRADHGIGITEANAARFGTGNCDGDFGDNCNNPSSYSLNLWIK